MKNFFQLTIILIFINLISATNGQIYSYKEDPFKQLQELLPSPNDNRLASGAPGPGYWQQKADYHIKVTLDDEKQRLIGSETIDYRNNSPHQLNYLWVQLDQNRFDPNSEELLIQEAPGLEGISFNRLRSQLYRRSFKGGHQIKKVTDKKGNEIKYNIIGTMMRIDLENPIPPKSNYVFNIDWEYNIIDADLNRARGGYEYFKEDKNYIYEIAQWFPRMAAYTDYTGWQNKQFLGSGEFTLEFGNYKVEITAPNDHIVAATGELQNAKAVMSDTQIKRWNEAKKSGEITFIVTPEEAKKNQSKKNQIHKIKDMGF